MSAFKIVPQRAAQWDLKWLQFWQISVKYDETMQKPFFSHFCLIACYDATVWEMRKHTDC